MPGEVKTARRLAGADSKDLHLRVLKAFAFDTTGNGARTVEQNLPYLVITNLDSVGHTFTLQPRAAKGETTEASPQIFVGPNSEKSIPTLPFALCTIDTPNASVFGFFSDVPTAGPRGAAGSGASFVDVGFNAVAFGTTIFTPFASGGFITSATDANAQVKVNSSGVIKNLRINVIANTVDSGVITLTLRKNGVGAALTITFAAGATGFQDDVVDQVAFAPNDRLDWRLVVGGAAGAVTLIGLAEVDT